MGVCEAGEKGVMVRGALTWSCCPRGRSEREEGRSAPRWAEESGVDEETDECDGECSDCVSVLSLDVDAVDSAGKPTDCSSSSSGVVPSSPCRRCETKRADVSRRRRNSAAGNAPPSGLGRGEVGRR